MWFLKDIQIHDVDGVAKECLHSIKMNKKPHLVFKMDLEKAYDKVSWSFLTLILLYIVLDYAVTKWIMACISSTNFVVLVRGKPSSLFKSYRGLRKGWPLSPLLFLIVIEGLRRLVGKERTNDKIEGIEVVSQKVVTNILFMDDVLLFSFGLMKDWESFNIIINLYREASGLVVSLSKSSFYRSLMN